MTLLVPNVGEADGLNAFVNKAAATNLILKLFSNNITPAETDVDTDYTEATFTGYSSITLTGANWTVTPGAPSSAAYAQQQFTSTAGSQNQSIYGYFMTRTTSGNLALAERFTDGPYVIQNNGDFIQVTPNITMD